MDKVIVVLFALLAGLAGYGGVGYLSHSINTETYLLEIDNLIYRNEVANSNVLDQPNTDSPLLTAHDISSYAKYQQWYDFRAKSNLTDDIRSAYSLSAHLRPTWSETYLELYQIARANNQRKHANKYLQLAEKFGPHKLAVKLALVNDMFIHWEEMSVDGKIEASSRLLNLAKSNRYELSQMLNTSQAKSRICNLLEFNKLSFIGCTK